MNYPLSPANAPVYSDGDTTVTVALKGWKWSDGETVDAADVVFWLNMMRAEPRAFYGYAPGQLPDNLASYRAAGTGTVVLRLKSAVSPLWFTYNQLAEITPMPAAWDVTGTGAAAGSGGCAADSAADSWARCAAVYLTCPRRRRTRGLCAQPAVGGDRRSVEAGVVRHRRRRSGRARLRRTRPTPASSGRNCPASRTTPIPATGPSTRRCGPGGSTSATSRRRT